MRVPVGRPMHSASRQKSSATINGFYAVAEYVSQPIGMLLSAPYLLHHLGASQFGIWVMASSAVNSGFLVSSGFGDAGVKYISMYRGRQDIDGVTRIVRGMIFINVALSGLLAISLWHLAPFMVDHIPHMDANLQVASVRSVRIGSLLLAVRSVDGVFVSTLRAFERYGPAVRVAISSRVSALAAAIVLVAHGYGVVAIMLATLWIFVCAAIAQGFVVRRIVGKIILLPSLHRETLSLISGFGCFSWLQAIAAAAFSHADRLVIGFYLGAPAVAVYSLCAQAAQTIHGVVGAGLHALFPHLSSRLESEAISDLAPTIKRAFKINLALAASLGAPVVLLSRPLLSLWMGPEFSRQAWPVLSLLGGSFTLFAINVTAYYALLAVGQVKIVTYANVAAGASMLVLMLLLTPRFAMLGTASSRLICGPITCLLYYPLYRLIHAKRTSRCELATRAAWENS